MGADRNLRAQCVVEPARVAVGPRRRVADPAPAVTAARACGSGRSRRVPAVDAGRARRARLHLLEPRQESRGHHDAARRRGRACAARHPTNRSAFAADRHLGRELAWFCRHVAVAGVSRCRRARRSVHVDTGARIRAPARGRCLGRDREGILDTNGVVLAAVRRGVRPAAARGQRCALQRRDLLGFQARRGSARARARGSARRSAAHRSGGQELQRSVRGVAEPLRRSRADRHDWLGCFQRPRVSGSAARRWAPRALGGGRLLGLAPYDADLRRLRQKRSRIVGKNGAALHGGRAVYLHRRARRRLGGLAAGGPARGCGTIRRRGVARARQGRRLSAVRHPRRCSRGDRW